MTDTYQVEVYRAVTVEAENREDAIKTAIEKHDTMQIGCDGVRVDGEEV